VDLLSHLSRDVVDSEGVEPPLNLASSSLSRASFPVKHPAMARIPRNHPESPGIETRSYRDHAEYGKSLEFNGLPFPYVGMPMEHFRPRRADRFAESRAEHELHQVLAQRTHGPWYVL
jgi:hypothetical protein